MTAGGVPGPGRFRQVGRGTLRESMPGVPMMPWCLQPLMRPASAVRYLSPRLWVSGRGICDNASARAAETIREGPCTGEQGPSFFIAPRRPLHHRREPYRAQREPLAWATFAPLAAQRGSPVRATQTGQSRAKFSAAAYRDCTSVSARCDCSDKLPEGNGPRRRETAKPPGFGAVFASPCGNARHR